MERMGILVRGTALRRSTTTAVAATSTKVTCPGGSASSMMIPGPWSVFARSKHSESLTKGRITPKTTPKRGWYKGVGCRSLGIHTRKGGYKVVPNKVPVYVVPDLTDCPLKPYVSWTTPRTSVPPLRLPAEKEVAQIE